MNPTLLSPGELAQRAGVTVRTLHHYEASGLLAPQRSEAGHRRYRPDDVQRLLRIVWMRRLGFALEQIGELLAGDAGALREALRGQRERLRAELSEAAERLQALDQVITELSPRRPDMSLNDLNPPQPQPGAVPFADEAQARWGSTSQWRTAEQRRQARTPDAVAAMNAEEAGLLADWAVLLRGGVAADAPAALAMVQAHRAHIDRWHYPCDRAMHARLAQLYTGDERFAAHFDAVAPGLAAYVAAGITAAAGAQ
jgi:MerR family transcriptional regulator, thiopeptide resistance regulator